MPHQRNRNFSSIFPDAYVEQAFLLWYRLGKPTKETLYKHLPDINGRKPSETTLSSWIKKWQFRAAELDRYIQQELDKRLIREKVEMLRRHTEIAEKMQDIAVSEIERHIQEENGKLRPQTALRMLVEGIRIEKESRGIPSMLSKISKQTDEQLLDEIKKLLSSGKSE